MKKILILTVVLVISLTVFGCKSTYNTPDTPSTPEEVLQQPFIADTIEYADMLIMDYGEASYTSYSDFDHKVNYFFPEGIELVSTGNTVKVNAWITCGTGLPENYDPFLYNSEVYRLADDIYNGFFLFIKNADTGVYHPITRMDIYHVYREETLADQIDRIYGEGSTDTLTGVIVKPIDDQNRYELPKEVADKLIEAIKTSEKGSADIGFQDVHYFSTDHTVYFILANKLEFALPFSSDLNYIAGMKIDQQLSKAILDNITGIN